MDSAGQVSDWNNYTAMCATIFATTLFRYVDIGGQVSHMDGAGEWTVEEMQLSADSHVWTHNCVYL